MNLGRLEPVRTLHLWLPGCVATRLRNMSDSHRSTITRVWVTIADHFEPWWRRADDRIALERVQRWARCWPRIARRHVDDAGRPPCYTFFYPEEQYHPAALDALSRLAGTKVADVEVHLHHHADSEAAFVDRVGTFIERLHTRHGLLRRDDRGIRFGFVHGNWALDNSLPGGRDCGLSNEITLLRRLGCYADFTLPAAPSPAQTRIVNTIYWATDDPTRPKSHDTGVPVTARSAAGDLLMIPGPLTLNLREWRRPLVPRIEVGELAGHCQPTRHRVTLWKRAAPRIGEDLFIKLFAHGAPEKNAVPLLADDGVLDRALRYLADDCRRSGTQLYFVSAWHMWMAIDAVRRGLHPVRSVNAARRERVTRVSAPRARSAGAEQGEGLPASDGGGRSGGVKPPGLLSDWQGAPQARPAGAERGDGVPASDGDGGSGGAKPPGLVGAAS
jgi:hypothetical protein